MIPTNYKGAALRSQRVWSKEERESKATDRAAGEAYERESDDGRGDEAHPDSGWCEDFNAGQRNDPQSDNDAISEADADARDAFEDARAEWPEEF